MKLGLMIQMVFIALLYISCKSNQASNPSPIQSTIVESPSKQLVTVIKTEQIPLAVPGEWTKWHIDPKAKKHQYINEDSVMLSVTIHHQIHLPFFSRKLTPWALVERYYQSDTVKMSGKGYTSNRISENEKEKYLVGRFDKEGSSKFLLIAKKSVFVFHISLDDGLWSQAQKISFLYDVNRMNSLVQ